MRITDKIHILKLDFEIKLSPDKTIKRFVNSVVIFGDKITLIDTGVKGSEEVIFNYIIENNRKPSEIDTVILSHSHPDHIGSAYEIKEKTGCYVLAHEAERFWIENIETQAEERPVPGFFDLVSNSVKIEGFLRDEELFDADKDITLKIIHCPGHSKGSVNVLFKQDRILFAADSIPLKNNIPNYDNFNDLVKSLNFIKKSEDYDILLTSWTPPLMTKAGIKNLIEEGEAYLKKIDTIVKNTYTGEEARPLDFCEKVISQLGLPAFLAVPFVDKSLRGHLRYNITT